MAEVLSLDAKRGLHRDTTKYAWSEDFEHALADLLSKSPSLWNSVGKHLDPGAILHATTATVMKVVQDHVARFGRGPGTDAAFASHLETMHAHDRKIPEDERTAVLDALLEAPELSPEDIRDQAAFHVKQRRRKHVLSQIEHMNAKGQNIGPLLDEMRAIEDIGAATALSVETINTTDDIFGMIRANRSADRTSTGIPELDERLEGGPVRKTISTFGGASGAGKSWCLCQAACVNLLLGRRVLYVDSEMGAEPAYARIVGWLTGLPEQDIINTTPEAERRWAIARQHIGPLVVKYVPPGTNIDRLRDFAAEAKRAPGFEGEIDVFLLDYGDKWKAGPGQHDLRKDEILGYVWETFRDVVVENNGWGFIGSQLKDLGEKQVPAWDDLARSRMKGEISDYVFTFWKIEDDAEERRFNVAKARRAPESEITDPLINQLDKCRIVPPDIGDWDAQFTL